MSPVSGEPGRSSHGEGLLTLLLLATFGLLPFAGLLFASHVDSLDLGVATLFLMSLFSARPRRRARAADKPELRTWEKP
jgi:hypothetical protein